MSGPDLHARIRCLHGIPVAVVVASLTAPGGAAWTVQLECCAACASEPTAALCAAIVALDRADPGWLAAARADPHRVLCPPVLRAWST